MVLNHTALKENWFTGSKTLFNSNGITVGFELEVLHDRNLQQLNNCVFNDDEHRHIMENYFSFKYDGSIRGYGSEIVSRPLSNDNIIYALKNLTLFLKLNKMRSGTSCGFHIHYGGDLIKYNKMNQHKILLTSVIYKNILRQLLPRHRQNNRFCSFRQLNASHSLFRKEIAEQPEEFFNRSGNYNSHINRYQYVNFRSLSKFGTIEFRCFQSSTSYDTLLNSFKTGFAVIDFSCNNSYDIISRLDGSVPEFLDFVVRDKNLARWGEKKIARYGTLTYSTFREELNNELNRRIKPRVVMCGKTISLTPVVEKEIYVPELLDFIPKEFYRKQVRLDKLDDFPLLNKWVEGVVM